MSAVATQNVVVAKADDAKLQDKLTKHACKLMMLELPELKQRAKKKGIPEDVIEAISADDEDDTKAVLVRLMLKAACMGRPVPTPMRKRDPEPVEEDLDAQSCQVCAGCIRPPGHDGMCMDGQCNEIEPPVQEVEDESVQIVAEEFAQQKATREKVERKLDEVARQEAVTKEEARRKVLEEQARKKTIKEEARRKAEEEAREKAEFEALLKAAAEEGQRKADEEAAQQKAEWQEALRQIAAKEEARQKAAVEESQRKAAEDARQKSEWQEAARKIAAREEAQQKVAAEEAQKKAAEDVARQQVQLEEAARQLAAKEEALRIAAQELEEAEQKAAAQKDKEAQMTRREEEQERLMAEEEEEMSQLCVETFLESLKPSRREKIRLPLKGSNLYTKHIRPCRPAGTSVDVKDSSFRNLGNFLKFLEDEGLLRLKPGLTDPVVTDIRIENCRKYIYVAQDAQPAPSLAPSSTPSVSVGLSGISVSLRPTSIASSFQ